MQFKDAAFEILKEAETFMLPLGFQGAIVVSIERELAIVEGNRELIRLYEDKVKKERRRRMK